MDRVFDHAFDHLLEIECGYVNDPRDPGGETKFGISKRQYPKLNIANLTREKAMEIYRHDYWQLSGCYELPEAVAVAVFDSAVNQGCDAKAGYATQKMLQSVVGATQDGKIGPKTLKKVNRMDEAELLDRFMAARAIRYVKTGNFDSFGRGWMWRLMKVQRYAAGWLIGGHHVE